MPGRASVLITGDLPTPVTERLARSCEVTMYGGEDAMPRGRLLRQIAGMDAVITLPTDRVDDELLDAAGERLLIVANCDAGFDNVDVSACSRRGVVVSNAPGVPVETTADLVWALLLAAARRVAEGDRFVRAGRPW